MKNGIHLCDLPEIERKFEAKCTPEICIRSIFVCEDCGHIELNARKLTDAD